MDVDAQSVEAASSSSDDSDNEVIACYRQLPIQQQQPSVGGRQMTTDLPGCSDSALPDFLWDEFESILLSSEEQANPLVRRACPSGTSKIDSLPIRHC